MEQKKARTTARASASPKREKNGRRRPADPAGPDARRPQSGVGAEVLNVQRNLWKAGLSALSRGSQLAASTSGATKITESLQGGLKRLEEVFDQRVLESLARTGMPSPGEMHDLVERVAELEEKVRRLMSRGVKK